MNSEYRSLLPSNATPQELALEAATSRLACLDAGLLRTLWNPATIPANLLAWLAWTLSVDEWMSDWDEATKRAVIAESYQLHLKKGTVYSVRRLLELVGFPDARLVEWFNLPQIGTLGGIPVGTPHTFAIGFDPTCSPDVVLDEDLFHRIERLLAHTAPVRSHMCLFLDLRASVDVPIASAGSAYQSTQHAYCLNRSTVTQELSMAVVSRPVQAICITGEY